MFSSLYHWILHILKRCLQRQVLNTDTKIKKKKRKIGEHGQLFGYQFQVPTSELDFRIWNANWPVKCEAKMAAYRGQFCTSVLVSYAVLYVSFGLPHDFLHFSKEFSLKIHKIFLQKTETSLRISNIILQSQTQLQVIYFYENRWSS